jgi:periplasmic divalent cation tolerance protein
MSEVLLVMTNTPDIGVARKIAAHLLEKKLAACVNIVSACESHYRWRGKLESAGEVQVLIKSTAGRYAEIEAAILAVHTYELPEIIAVPVLKGSPGYLAWVAEETATL